MGYVMSDSWDDYLAGADTDGSGGSTGGVVDIGAQLDAAGVDVDAAATATDWGNWNAATTEEYSADAQNEISYASDAYASGWDDVGDAAMSRAGSSLDTAADHAATAAGYYATADSDFGAAAEQLTVAADSVESVGYDTVAVDTSGDGASSYDSGSDDSV